MDRTADSMESIEGDRGAGRPPSLAAQTPGLDTTREARTLRDAVAYHGRPDEPGTRHILVPLDGSRLAAAALPYAVALARATGARLSLLAVVAPATERAGLPSAAAQEGDERHVTETSAYLESVAAPLRARGLAVTTVVRHGNPADTILADSEEEECSLIAMGTHGRTGLARVRAGSVAQHVLRHAIIPTLVVPPGNDASAGGEAAVAGVTATLDGSDVAEAALPFAARIAAALAVPLTLLRVIPTIAPLPSAGWDVGYSGYYPMNEEMERDEERAVAEYLEATAARLRAPGLEVRTTWVRGATSGADEAIATSLAQRPTGIAVMASHGRGGILRWVLGSNAEGVLDRAPCPILIVRAGATNNAGHEAMHLPAVQVAR